MDYFLDLENELSKYYGLESFFIFKKRYSRLILADKFEAIFSESYQNLAVLSSKKIDLYIDRIKSLIADKKQDDYKDKCKTAFQIKVNLRLKPKWSKKRLFSL